MKGFNWKAADAAIVRRLGEADQALVEKMANHGHFEKIFAKKLDPRCSNGMGEDVESKHLFCANLMSIDGHSYRFLFASRTESTDLDDVVTEIYDFLNEEEISKTVCYGSNVSESMINYL